MQVTAVYPNGNFHVKQLHDEFDVRQVTHSKPVVVGDEIEFYDYKFHTVKTIKDGRPISKVIILSFGFNKI